MGVSSIHHYIGPVRFHVANEYFSPGRLMHAIGNVRVSLGDLEKGLDWHRAAWRLYVDTIGEGHHRTADVCHRLAHDYMKQEDYPEARFAFYRKKL